MTNPSWRRGHESWPRRLHAAWLAALAWLLATAAGWADPVSVNLTAHAGFLRLAFTAPASIRCSAAQDDATLILHCPSVSGWGTVTNLPPGLTALRPNQDFLTVVAAPGTKLRHWHRDQRMVVDIYPPSLGPAAGPQAVHRPHPLPAPAPAVAPVATPAAMEPSLPTLPAPWMIPTSDLPAALQTPPPPPKPAPPTAVPPGPASVHQVAAKPTPAAMAGGGLAVSVLPGGDVATPSALFVPCGKEVGAAAFVRGGDAHVVFDAPQPLDIALLQGDPVFGGVVAHTLAAGSDLTWHLPAKATLDLTRRADGWLITLAISPTANVAEIMVARAAGALQLAAAAPGRVLTMDDPVTGGRLLIGTQLAGGQHVSAAYEAPELVLLPSLLGVLLAPVSDRVDLRVDRQGFVALAESGPRLALMASPMPAPATAQAVSMTRRFDFPNLPVPMLRIRLRDMLADESAIPKADRFTARLRTAQAMLALGMDVEAAALLSMAAEDDPTQASDPDAAGLSAIADWLTHGPLPDRFAPPSKNPAALDNPALGNSDEIGLWRALLHGNHGDADGPASALAARWPLILDYPPALRAKLLPYVAQALAEGGQTQALAALLAAAPDHALDLARARAARDAGKLEAALVALDALARQPDRLVRAQALRDAVELRLTAGKMDAGQAANALEQQLYAWRDGERDLDLRLRVAALRARSGAWRAAIALLRDSEPLFPESRDRLHAAQLQVVADLLKNDGAAKMAPLDLVAFVADSADLLGETDKGASLAPVLVDKLLALDLPDRAEPILAQLVDKTSTPAPKAELGLRLADLRLTRGDPVAALAALDQSEQAGLADALSEQRRLLRARALADSGNGNAALALLAARSTQAALTLQATLLEQRQDWHAAEAAVAALAQPDLAGTTPLSGPQQDLVLRLASDASRAGDMDELRTLQASAAPRFAPGPQADLLRVLTTPPVQDVSDLARSSQEIAAARGIPAALAAYHP